MTALSIYLFGSVQVVRDESYPVNLRPTAKAMLAFLLLNGRPGSQQLGHRREVLADRFWGKQEERQARRSLSTTLWRLRRELEPDDTPKGTYLIAPPTGEVGFNFKSDHWLDIIAFESKVAAGMARPVGEMEPEDAQALEEAHLLYRGELLEDCYGDWVYRERERLNLPRLMRYYEHHGRYQKSLACALNILAIDPLREQVHRHIMRLHASNGQRALAVQQYELCRQILAEELGIQPMAETQALNREILSADNRLPSQAEPISNNPGALQMAFQQLKAAMRSVDEAQTQLRQARKLVARLVEARPADDIGLGD
jgi:DNA-binding SARP family transcriptional activator